MRLLIVEDDPETRGFLERGLREAGHVCDSAADGVEGLAAALDGQHDAMVVDRMLPRLDGLALIRALRAEGRATPVLVLSALAQVDDRVQGLRAGGDDYLAKPFAFSELLARLDALTRRHAVAGAEATVLRAGDLELDLMARTARRAGREIPLLPREFQILEYFLRRPGRVVTRTMLLEGVWDYRFDPQTNVIDVHISRLRQKIDKDFDVPLLHTVRGAGYMLKAPA